MDMTRTRINYPNAKNFGRHYERTYLVTAVLQNLNQILVLFLKKTATDSLINLSFYFSFE